MTEYPILFSTPMVSAILEGRKTQTRRVVKEPVLDLLKQGLTLKDDYENGNTGEIIPIKQLCPYGQPGDRLWVRETHYLFGYWIQDGATKTGKPKWRFVCDKSKGAMFVDNPPPVVCTRRDQSGWFKRPSIHMPRWACRTVLENRGVRMQRLQDISAQDILAEGCDNGRSNPTMGMRWENMQHMAWQRLWDSINAARGHGWAVNDWVWAVSFRRVTQ